MRIETTELTADAARADDVDRIVTLLALAAPETIPLPADEVRAELERFVVLRAPGRGVVAVAALHAIDARRLELRSVAVAPAWRGHGLGRRLIECALERAARMEGAIRTVACFTFRPTFFQRLGFSRVALESLPIARERPAELDGRPRVAMVADLPRAARAPRAEAARARWSA